MSDKDIKVLWEVARNLIYKPRPIKVVKECAKTFWLDRLCDKKVTKHQERNESNCVGYTRYCSYYATEEDANRAYNKQKELQDKRAYDLHYQGNTREAVKKFCEKLKAQYGNITDYDSGELYVEVGYDELDKLFIELYGDDEK